MKWKLGGTTVFGNYTLKNITSYYESEVNVVCNNFHIEEPDDVCSPDIKAATVSGICT
jgi:hypothetical protein